MAYIHVVIASLVMVLPSVTADDHHHEYAFVEGKADIAQCVGDMITTAGFLSSAGMLIASIHRECTMDEAHCTKQVAGMTRAFAKAAAMSSMAAEHCGGHESPCGFSVSQAAVEIAKAAAAATGFAGAYSPKGFRTPKVTNAQSAAREVGQYLQHAADRITDAVAQCAKPGDGEGSPDVTGYCVGKATRAALDLAAAGLQIDTVKADCPTANATAIAAASEDVKKKCSHDFFYVLLDSSKTATRMAEVAATCAKQGKAKCSTKVTDFVRAVSRIGLVGSSDAWEKPVPGAAGAGQLDDLADALKGAAVDVNDAVQACGDGSDTNATCGDGSDGAQPCGACVGDALSGATHISAAGLTIAAAAQDCQNMETMGQKINCAKEIMKSMAEFAHASMELMDAAADCGRGKMYDTLCGLHVSHGFHVLGKAGIFGAKAAEFAGQSSALDEKAPNYDGLAVAVGKLSKDLQKFSTAMDEANGRCKMVGEPFQSKFNVMNSDARKWLSAGAGQWRNRKQSTWQQLSGTGLFALVALLGLTMLLSIKKLVARHRGTNQDALGARVLQADTQSEMSEQAASEQTA